MFILQYIIVNRNEYFYHFEPEFLQYLIFVTRYLLSAKFFLARIRTFLTKRPIKCTQRDSCFEFEKNRDITSFCLIRRLIIIHAL